MGPRLGSGSPGPRSMGDCCSPRDSGWLDAWTMDRPADREQDDDLANLQDIPVVEAGVGLQKPLPLVLILPPGELGGTVGDLVARSVDVDTGDGELDGLHLRCNELDIFNI